MLTTHVLFGRPVLESLMFSVALAVGLTPELLPMITTVTLSRGALRMAGRKVIVKRLASIHDLGAMTVLCTDKTGTLTSAEITLASSLDAAGTPTIRAPRGSAPLPPTWAATAARSTRRWSAGSPGAAQGWTLAGAARLRLQPPAGLGAGDGPEGQMLIVKGAPEAVLALCTSQREASGWRWMPMGAVPSATAQAQVRALAEEGLRAVAVASRPWSGAPHEVEAADEDGPRLRRASAPSPIRPKPTAAAAIARLGGAGVRLKILSGDDPVVVKRLAGLVGLNAETVLSGADIAALSDDALAVQVQRSTPTAGWRPTRSRGSSRRCSRTARSSASSATASTTRRR